MSGARTRRIRRIAAALPLVKDLRAYEDGRNRDWMFRHDSRENPALWLVTPISHGTRSDDARADSNYEVAERMLNEASGFSAIVKWPDWTAQDGTVYPGVSYLAGGTGTRHDAWPGGTIETLLVRADDAPALLVLERIIRALSDYPVLDDEHCSDLEWRHDHPSEDECYSEDEECPCAVRNHAHTGEGFGPEDAGENGEVYCRRCSAYVVPGSVVGDGNTHGEDDGSDPDQATLF